MAFQENDFCKYSPCFGEDLITVVVTQGLDDGDVHVRAVGTRGKSICGLDEFPVPIEELEDWN